MRDFALGHSQLVGNKVFVSCALHLFILCLARRTKYGDACPNKKRRKPFLTLRGVRWGELSDHDQALHSLVGRVQTENGIFQYWKCRTHGVTRIKPVGLRSGSVYTGGTPYNELKMSRTGQ